MKLGISLLLFSLFLINSNAFAENVTSILCYVNGEFEKIECEQSLVDYGSFIDVGKTCQMECKDKGGIIAGGYVSPPPTPPGAKRESAQDADPIAAKK